MWPLVVIVFLIPIFLGFYKITESPPVWYDEGIFTQVAINMAQGWGHVLRVGPQEFMPGQAVTTGLTVTFPISLVFRLFGVSLTAARVVMVLYVLLTVFLTFLFVKKLANYKTAILSSFLLISFAPLYGDGKSVMGEVPGLFFFLLTLYWVYKLEQQNSQNTKSYLWAGFAAGLCAISKPTYLVILPVLAILCLIFFKDLRRNVMGFIGAALACLVPLVIWVIVQYSGPPLMNVWEHYANPNSVNIWQAVSANLRLFVSELQPAYFLSLIILWVSSLFYARQTKQKISMAEALAFGFTLITLLVFLRTKGYYRYFFPAQVVAIVFLPIILERFKALNIYKKLKFALIPSLIIFLIIFQFYQTFFHSWISEYKNGTNSAELQSYFGNYNSSRSLLLYDVPEVGIFLPPATAYYQYIKISDEIIIGQDNLDKVAQKIPRTIVMSGLFWSLHQDSFAGFKPVSTTLSRYVVLQKVE